MGTPVVTPRVDEITGAAIQIEFEHHELHEGDKFNAHYEGAVTNIGEETAIAFLTPGASAGRIHMTIDVRADDESVFEFRENPTVVLNQGTAQAPLNRFRDSDNTSAIKDQDLVASNSVSTYDETEAAAANLAAGGAVLESETIAIAAGPPFGAVANSQSRGQREWVLKENTIYCVILTASTNNATMHEISLNWCEHVDKDFVN